jgi:hypothetical protein
MNLFHSIMISAAACASTFTAFAQPLPPPPPRAPFAGVAGTSIEARVSGYLLSAEAEVAGLLLEDGSQVRMPPHLSDQLTALTRPGDSVTIVGEREPGGSIRAASITSRSSGRTLVDAPPVDDTPPLPPHLRAARAAPLQAMQAEGAIRRVITGPRGEISGLLLDNGMQVQLPPFAAGTIVSLLAAGARLHVEGYGRTSSYGTVLQATSLGRPGQASVPLYR